MIVYDASGVKTAISPDGSGSVYDAQGRRVSASSTTGNLYSYDNAPASPSGYDDEFNATSLNAKWTLTSTGTTNPAVVGTVNPVSSLTTPVYDLSTMPSWLLFQSDNSSAQTVSFTQSVTLGTAATFFYKACYDNRNFSAAAEGQTLLQLRNSGDANEAISCHVQEGAGNGFRIRLAVTNNGAVTEIVGAVMAELSQVGPWYIALWKNTNNYYGGFAQGDGTFTVVGPVTKTGVTTFDQVILCFYTANETPSAIAGIDFFRYYSTITYGLKNATV